MTGFCRLGTRGNFLRRVGGGFLAARLQYGARRDISRERSFIGSKASRLQKVTHSDVEAAIGESSLSTGRSVLREEEAPLVVMPCEDKCDEECLRCSFELVDEVPTGVKTAEGNVVALNRALRALDDSGTTITSLQGHLGGVHQRSS